MNFLNSVFIPALALGGLYGLIALGFAVLFRVTGVLNFAHGQLVMLAPLGVLVFHAKAGFPLALAYVLAVVVVVLVALVEERIAIRPFIQSGQQLPWIVSTLGVSVILGELLAIPYSGQSVDFPYGIDAQPVHFLGGLRTTPADASLVGGALVLAAVLHLVYVRTPLGLRMQAVAENLRGAAAIGIDPRRVSQLAAGVAALVAAATGLLLAPTQLVAPSLGLQYTFYGFVAASLGGLGSLGGAVLGGFVVALVTQASGVYVGSLYVNLMVFGALLAVYLVRPYGVFGRPPLRAV